MADTQPKVDTPAVEATTTLAAAETAPAVDQTQQKESKTVTIDDPKSEEAAAPAEDKTAEEGEKPKKENPLKKIVASLKGLFKCLPGRRESAPKKDEAGEESVKEGGDKKDEDKPELPAVAGEDNKKSEPEGVASTMTTTITATPAN
ncbi:hypothetical protein QBC38DRAFT_548312 [Podospora fimiseda]|uniref:Uncharacterized protein n=1 Tax=Podospora fimiseda TaxID=252190 RepID=A0AAN7BI29_9PEZI|nr:hypothetical protein QBC38DRAFT_548312 [Podospora fimiseda]